MSKADDFENRIVSEQGLGKSVSNAMLDCHNCVYAVNDSVNRGNVSKCLSFGVKPTAIIGGAKCERKRAK